ncbi:MAG: hypothetical protein V4495_14545 [Pseudomonadota bacterium]
MVSLITPFTLTVLASSPASALGLLGATHKQVSRLGQAATSVVITLKPAHCKRGHLRHASLYLKGIRSNKNPGTAYRIFLNLPQDAQPDPQRKEHIGDLNFYGIDQTSQRDYSIPFDPQLLISSHMRTCTATIIFVPMATLANGSTPGIDAIEIWGK